MLRTISKITRPVNMRGYSKKANFVCGTNLMINMNQVSYMRFTDDHVFLKFGIDNSLTIFDDSEKRLFNIGDGIAYDDLLKYYAEQKEIRKQQQ